MTIPSVHLEVVTDRNIAEFVFCCD